MSDSPAAAAPRFRIGTSGYNYPEWKGSFYPEKLPARKMLPYYAQRLETVEINYTFYRLPTRRLLAGWSEVTPPGFAFTLKAPRRITHEARLRRCEELTGSLLRGGRLARRQARGAALPTAAVLQEGPPAPRRVPGNAARPARGAPSSSGTRRGTTTPCSSGCRRPARRCASPTASGCRRRSGSPPSHAYFRLRDEGYTEADVTRWAETILQATTACSQVYVYFKHEESGKGPALARQLDGSPRPPAAGPRRGRLPGVCAVERRARRAACAARRVARLPAVPPRELDHRALGPVAVETRGRRRQEAAMSAAGRDEGPDVSGCRRWRGRGTARAGRRGRRSRSG